METREKIKKTISPMRGYIPVAERVVNPEIPPIDLGLNLLTNTSISTPSVAPENLITVQDMAKTAGQAIARQYAATGARIASQIPLLGKPSDDVIDPNTYFGTSPTAQKAGIAIFGKDKPFNATIEDKEFLEAFGTDPNISSETGGSLTLLLTALDFTGASGAPKGIMGVIRALKYAKTAEETAKIARSVGFSEDIINSYKDIWAKTKTTKETKIALESAVKLQASTKASIVPRAYTPVAEREGIELGTQVIKDSLPPLSQEAQKYSSAEEFVKGQPTYYRAEGGGTDPAQGKALLAEGRHFAMDSEYPKRFGDVKEYVAKPDAKVFDASGLDFKNIRAKLGLEPSNYLSPTEYTKALKANGYDILKYDGTYKSTGKDFVHTVEITPNSLIPKSQLTAFFDKVKGGKKLDSLEEIFRGKITQEIPAIKSLAEPQIPQKIVRPSKEAPISPEKLVVPRKTSLEPIIKDKGKEIKVNVGTPEEKLKATTEDTQSIKDILNKSEMRIRATSAVGKPKTPRDLVQEITDNVRKQNETLKDPEIAKLRADNLLSAETIDEIILRKRGIITDKEAIERAKNIRGTIDDVLNLPKGAVPTKEQLTAISQIVQGERELNLKLIQLIDGKGVAQSADERALIAKLGKGFGGLDQHEILNRALAESTLKLKKAEIVLLGMRGEIGRSLQATKIVVEAVDSRMRIVFGKINKLNATEQQAFLEKLAKEDVRDDKKFIKFLDELNTADFFDKFAEYSTAAKLWNPTTHAVNLGGNTIRQFADVLITSIISPRTIKADIAGMRIGLRQGLKNSFRALTDDGYASQLSKYIEEGGTAPAIGGKLGQWVRTPFRMLGAGDEIFRAIGFQRSLYRQAYTLARKEGLSGTELNKRMEALLKNPTLEMLEEATGQAKRLTFQEDMGELTQKINNFRTPANFESKTGKSMSLLLRFFLPFLKTPTNLLKQAVDFSPLGGLKNFTKIKEAAKVGDTETVGRLIGESVIGTALTAYIVMETLDGNITGGAPKGKAEKDRFYREKKLPYAIKIGDTWYQYKRVDPFSTVIGLVSDATTLAGDEDISIASLVNVLANQMADKTYLSGIDDFMNLLTGEKWEREYALKSMILGATMPSFVGHTARSTDPTVRKTDTTIERIKSQIPFVSESLPAQVNVLGENIERANKGLNYFFNPIQSEVAEIDPITKHLMDIDKTLPLPQDYFSRDGVKYELDAETYSRYAKEIGTKLKDGIESLMRTPSYQKLSEEKKSDEIDKLRKDIGDEWKDKYIGIKSTTGAKSLESIFGAPRQGKSLETIFK